MDNQENNQNKNQKAPSKKTCKILLCIGIPLLICSIIFIIIGISSFSKGIASDVGVSGFSLWPFAIGGFLGLIGFALTAIGATPYITKLNAKVSNETLDYAGEDLKKVGKKGAEVASPAIQEVTKNITHSIKNSKVKTCPYCNDEIDDDEAFCSGCGKPLKKVCPNCKKVNDSKNKFCKYCGKKL